MEQTQANTLSFTSIYWALKIIELCFALSVFDFYMENVIMAILKDNNI